MNAKRLFLKIMFVCTSCSAVLIMLWVFSAYGDSLGINKEKVAYIGNFVAEKSHTGMVPQSMQIAFNDKDNIGNKFAINKINRNNGYQLNQEDNNIEQMPVVLFDISSQPVSEKQKHNIIAFLFISVIAFFALLYFANRVYRKIRIKKIKLITRNTK